MKTKLAERKQGLAEHYNSEALHYRNVNYAGGVWYAPLQQRQFYIERMIEDCRLPAGSKILDIGCGPGELVHSLVQKGFEVWGVDISESMIGIARKKLGDLDYSPSERLGVGDIENLEFSGGFFNAVIASGVIEYQKDDDDSLREMNRVLHPGGILILNVTNRIGYLNWFDNLYRWLKAQPPARKVIRLLKEKVLHRGELHDFPDRRTHLPARFDKKLTRFGFKKVSHNFFHFSPLPMPLDSAFFGICQSLGRRMERLTASPLAPLLAGGYLLIAEKTLAPKK